MATGTRLARLVLPLSFPLALALPLAAQTSPRVLPGPLPPGAEATDFRPEVVRATYDVRRGRVKEELRLPAGVLAATAPPTACFDNSDLACDMGPFEPYTIGNDLGDELVDWGVKACGGSKLAESITIAYRTSALDVQDGGPGATIGFALYSGTAGFGSLGTELFRQVFTGMPAQRAPAGITHEAPFVFLTLDFGDAPLLLPDGKIGWGYEMLDNVDPTFATGALLVTAPSTTTGVIDALDVYAPGPATLGNYTGTFNFGSTCNHPPCCPNASTWIQITQANGDATMFNGNDRNPVLFAQGTPLHVGQIWAATFDLTAHPGTTSTMIFASFDRLDQPLQTPFGEVLLDMAGKAGTPMVGMDVHFLQIPNDPSLFGLTVFTQGVVVDGVPMLTNGLRATLTF